MGNVNAHLIDAITVFADEITWGYLKSQGKLKGLITEDQLTGEHAEKLLVLLKFCARKPPLRDLLNEKHSRQIASAARRE